jgi:hypothetical protein
MEPERLSSALGQRSIASHGRLPHRLVRAGAGTTGSAAPLQGTLPCTPRSRAEKKSCVTSDYGHHELVLAIAQ